MGEEQNINVNVGYHHPLMGGYIPKPKSRTVAIVLALLLGGFGAHKFYLRKPGIAIVYILFAWTFIPAIVALIEGIIYAVQSDEEFAYKQGVTVV